MTQDFAQQARRSSDVSNTAGPVRTRRSNRDSFFGGQFGGPAMLQMGFGGSRQSTMIPTPTTPAQLQGPSGSGSSKQRRKDNDSVSVTSTSKEYFGGVMSKLSNAFSKAKHAVTGKESSDSLAAPGKRSKWGLPGSSRRSSVSSNAPYGYAEDGMHSPQLAMVPSETNSMYSRDEPAEDSVEGLISLSVSSTRFHRSEFPTD